MMDVLQKSCGKWVIIHAAREVAKDFDTEAEAWSWADGNIDDQVTCTPNWLADPIIYRSPPPDHLRSDQQKWKVPNQWPRSIYAEPAGSRFAPSKPSE